MEKIKLVCRDEHLDIDWFMPQLIINLNLFESLKIEFKNPNKIT